jgi:hypothetical protein
MLLYKCYTPLQVHLARLGRISLRPAAHPRVSLRVGPSLALATGPLSLSLLAKEPRHLDLIRPAAPRRSPQRPPPHRPPRPPGPRRLLCPHLFPAHLRPSPLRLFNRGPASTTRGTHDAPACACRGVSGISSPPRLLSTRARPHAECPSTPLQLHPVSTSLHQGRSLPPDECRPHPAGCQHPWHGHPWQVWVPATPSRPTL